MPRLCNSQQIFLRGTKFEGEPPVADHPQYGEAAKGRMRAWGEQAQKGGRNWSRSRSPPRYTPEGYLGFGTGKGRRTDAAPWGKGYGKWGGRDSYDEGPRKGKGRDAYDGSGGFWKGRGKDSGGKGYGRSQWSSFDEQSASWKGGGGGRENGRKGSLGWKAGDEGRENGRKGSLGWKAGDEGRENGRKG
eukprot:CAMPEP_0179335236 /NCGR_PEP_ID=MMETSP0797-20121207/66383_1 /TAXON_ID=47934 /ORGANISM="Dinophysis acuminata, Strain DAEP01" /LENGTH=188 /DNA_ID=CAMNT_0021048605 /DNA_START=17 /DNA_END=580 /DNA_ORIENTATION=+